MTSSIIPMTYQAAESRIQVIKEQIRKLESEMTDIALEHEICVYHNGAELMLNSDSYYGYERGEWLPSSATC